MTKNVILEDADGEELIPYTNLATSSIAGRVRPDNSTIAVDANGVISVNGVTGGEIGYLSGVTSAIQTQINGKQGTLTFDSTPTAGSSNPVTSGGVYSSLPTKLSDLTDDLGSNPVHTHNDKADKATTLAGYGISDAYTKNEIDTNKANKATTLAGYGISDAYTKNEIDTKFQVVSALPASPDSNVFYFIPE